MASSGLPSPDVYLAPNFEPSSLKVAQLRGLLYAHQVQVPSTAKKADLIQLFEDNVRPRAQKLLSDASSVKPSGVGITEIGHDGEPIPVPKAAKRPRQSKARKAAAPVAEPAVEVEDAGVDGETEDNDEEVVEVKKLPRRTTRRSVAASTSPPFDPAPVSLPSTARKSRKSTAAQRADEAVSPIQDNVQVVVPSTVQRAVRKKPSVAVLQEESEPEDEKEKGLSKAGKIAEETAAPVVARNIKGQKSVVVQEERDADVTSGNFSDFNPFQSGGEASPGMSVAETVRMRKKRQTLGGATTAGTPSKANRRKSEPGHGYPALVPDSPERTPMKTESTPRSGVTPPSLKKFQPELGQMRSPPDEWKRSRLSNVISEPEESQEGQTRDEEQEFDDVPVEESDLALYQQHSEDVQNKIARVTSQDVRTAAEKKDQVALTDVSTQAVKNLASDGVSVVQSTREGDQSTALVRHRPDSSASKYLSQLMFILLMSVLTPVLREWQAQSTHIGFCDTGSNVNNLLLQERRSGTKRLECKNEKIDNPEAACQLEQESFFDIVGIAPDSCTPCPEHAICENGQLTRCQQGYQLVPDWRQNSVTQYLLDGMPGAGPVAFPPSCQIDFKRKALGARIAKEIESDLAKRHGDIICSQGLWPVDNSDGKLEIVRDGMTEQELKDMLFAKMKLSKEDFKEQFDIAIKDLLAYNNIQTVTENGTKYYAAPRSVIPTSCAVRLKAVKETKQHKKELGLLSMISTILLLLQNRYKQRKAEDAQVKELVTISLAKLQDRKHLHFTEPTEAPEPYLRPDQMRDDVLVLVPQAQRNHLWTRVQSDVEHNANVQVAEEELFGDVWKTWEWIGSTRKDLQERSMFPVA